MLDRAGEQEERSAGKLPAGILIESGVLTATPGEDKSWGAVQL